MAALAGLERPPPETRRREWQAARAGLRRGGQRALRPALHPGLFHRGGGPAGRLLRALEGQLARAVADVVRVGDGVLGAIHVVRM